MKNKIAILIYGVILTLVASVWADDFKDFEKDSRLDQLSQSTHCFFDAARKNDESMLATCFSQNIEVNIAGMRFKGHEEVVAFAKRDIWGGKYKVEKVFKHEGREIVHCLFWPRGWSSPEPPIEYEFEIRNGKIIQLRGEYR